jgi:ABC-type transporter Mla MlaB component
LTLGTRLACEACTVECWIGVEHAGAQWLVRLAGRLSVDQVPDLLKVCGEHGSDPVAIELSDLLSADAAGIEALRRVRRAGALLTGTPTYIQLKLDTPA